ncbi:MAG: ATP-dependent sacrificial sulfur transferase LarE [Chloroflexi bacterium]|nr:ATP-dependent sacrificial sulfur transferase LarE [Chloroflexota bacterium]MDA1227144.1 ATP-dependent sacrificial sulfur transferase LarE [Chloroflexota bacterium]
MATEAKEARTTEQKMEALKSILKDMGTVIVAYSGGVDSAFLAATANDVLGDKALAVTANSPSLAPSELVEAKELAQRLGLNHRIIETHEVERDDYAKNDPNRCFFCKDELYTYLSSFAKVEGYDFITNGTNVDDLGDFRPGLNAAKQYGVQSPMVDADLTKAEIRELSKGMDLPTWDKPAQACLSSRIPYGTMVTVEALTRIAKAEAFLHDLGIKQLRVRHHDTVARIEVEPQDFLTLSDEDVRKRVVAKFTEIGYSYVTLDLQGFRSGSLNEVLAALKKQKQG